MHRYDAIVLAGGRGRRLGGVDKAALLVTPDQTLLDSALAVVHEAERVVVVGPPRELPPGVLQTTESPAGGGPVAAVAAGLELVAQELTVVLACDMPLLQSRHICHLMDRLDSDDSHDAPLQGVVLVDSAGRRQPLAALYRTAALRAAVARMPTVSGAAVRDLINPLTLAELAADSEVALDCDTWEQLTRVRALVDNRRHATTDEGGTT
jgi:molybdopterin-guanine dinucleotide biosynthesis protein A